MPLEPMRVADIKATAVLLSFLLPFLLFRTAMGQAPVEETQTAPATGAITGRVSEGGRAVPYATVMVRGSSPFAQPRLTSTDNDGNFQVNDLRAELYIVSASAPGYVTPPREEGPIPFARIGESLDLSLVKGGVITGSVRFANGEPVVQVAVKAIIIKDAAGRPPRFQPNPPYRLTDDRGIYRLYGLQPGTYLVAAGGRSSYGATSGAYDFDVPTYAPSSTRDTASEITVRAGDEVSGVEIRYRGDSGRTVTGVVTGLVEQSQPGLGVPTINMLQLSNGIALGTASTFQMPGGKGFTFYGVADGDYELTAQLFLGPGDSLVSDSTHITVKGGDLTGIELALKPLASISGKVTLENSTAPECKNKRRPLLSETMIAARRSEKGTSKNQLRPTAYFVAQEIPNKSGEFLLRSLGPGPYNLNARFFAKYWYLSSITREAPPAGPATAKAAPANRQIDLARNQLNLKTGERVSGVTFALAEGAASLRGTIKLGAGEPVPARLYVHLVPGEKEKLEDVLRVFAARVSPDGTFALNNLPPGRYWSLARVAQETETDLPARVRMPDESELRAQIRRAAQANKAAVEFQPCQNLLELQLPLASSPSKQ